MRIGAAGGFWRNNGLSVVLFSLFALTLAGQAVAGWYENRQDALAHGTRPVAFGPYLLSGHFWEATGENWESEFLQMTMFVLLTVWFRQKGSVESKRVGAIEPTELDPSRFKDEPDVPGPVRAGGWRLRVYENSLGLAFAALFLMSLGIHAAGGLREWNAEQTAHGLARSGMASYLSSARFWFESLQNWQSEFLSLAAMVVATIYLRQRGSAESKPVHAAHGETGR